MSKDKPYECVKVDFADLQNFMDKSSAPTDTSVPSPITDWSSIKSQVNLDGLKTFKESLEQPNKTVEDLRQEHSQSLLKDLERVSKRFEATRLVSLDNENLSVELLKFNESFKDEIKKPSSEWSEDLNKFVNQYSHLNLSGNRPEKCSAQMLLELNKDNQTVDGLKTALSSAVEAYKADRTTQTIADIGKRDPIFFKGKDGKTISLTYDELKESKELTGEQKDFIASAWNQGTFMGGFAGLHDSIGYGQDVILKGSDKTAILIDVSQQGVKVYARNAMDLMDNVDPELPLKPYVQITLEVDISKLQGTSFSPGCASANVPINAVIAKLDSEIPFNLPEGLKTTKSKDFDKTRINIIESAKEGHSDRLSKRESAVSISAEIATHEVKNLTSTKYQSSEEYKEAEVTHLENVSKLTSLSKIDRKFVDSLTTTRNEFVEQAQPDIISGKLTQDLIKPTIAVKLYNAIETDQTKQKEFAAKQVGEYVKSQTNVLDEKEKNRIKDGIIAILEPCCSSHDEKKSLRNNAGKLVRQAAEASGKKMSFAQGFHRFKDSVSKLFNKDDHLKDLMEKHPQLSDKLKEAMKPQAKHEKTPVTVNAVKKEHSSSIRK